MQGQASVFTDPIASSSGYPFKIVQLEGSLSESEVYDQRSRICDLGYLRSAYKRPDGTVGFRCSSEPVDDFVHKGGQVVDTEGKKCLCNGLMSTVGYPQYQKEDYLEPPLITAGKELSFITSLVKEGKTSYSARDVLDFLLSGNRKLIENCCSGHDSSSS